MGLFDLFTIPAAHTGCSD